MGNSHTSMPFLEIVDEKPRVLSLLILSSPNTTAANFGVNLFSDSSAAITPA